MAHFIGYLQGNRGQASRLGTKSSSISAQAQGWNVGASILVSYNEQTEQDEVSIHLTSGSSGRGGDVHLGTFTVDDLNKKQKCSVCGGSGKIISEAEARNVNGKVETCSTCKGKGKV